MVLFITTAVRTSNAIKYLIDENSVSVYVNWITDKELLRTEIHMY
jgi:hypothetical protein